MRSYGGGILARKGWYNSGYKPTDDPAFKDLKDICGWLADGDLEKLEFASQVVDSFPHDKDGFFGTHWIVHAIGSGCVSSVKWMIEKGVDPCVRPDDGYPPLLACIDNPSAGKHQILGTLIDAGADINQRGINGWTPLHLAAIRDDEKAMHMLLTAGADRTITTQVDDNATAEEEARILGNLKSADFIASFKS